MNNFFVQITDNIEHVSYLLLTGKILLVAIYR